MSSSDSTVFWLSLYLVFKTLEDYTGAAYDMFQGGGNKLTIACEAHQFAPLEFFTRIWLILCQFMLILCQLRVEGGKCVCMILIFILKKSLIGVKSCRRR